jgi:hypothetical protein
MASVDVTGIEEARVAVAALRNVDADLRKEVNKQTRSVLNPIWRDEINSRTSHPMDSRVLAKNARVTAGTRPALVAAKSSRALSGGLVPSQSWQAYEFGGNRHKVKEYTGRSPKGKSYRMKRKTQRQLPQKTKGGRVLIPSTQASIGRIGSLWSQTSIWLVFEALKKGFGS